MCCKGRRFPPDGVARRAVHRRRAVPQAASVPRARRRAQPVSAFMNDRRAFLGYCSALGLGSTAFPGLLWGLTQEAQERVTAAMVKQAEQLAGLEFTEQERENLVRGLNGNLRNYEQIRAVEIANALPPAVQFDPVLPGVQLPVARRPFRYTRERGVRRPPDLEAVAFWPV